MLWFAYAALSILTAAVLWKYAFEEIDSRAWVPGRRDHLTRNCLRKSSPTFPRRSGFLFFRSRPTNLQIGTNIQMLLFVH